MIADAVQRKLTAILSADAVGYSRLMAQAEVETVKTLNAHRGLIGGLVRQHGGRVVDAVGDNLLAEFPSVVDAVTGAVAIQDELAKRNADLPTDGQMPFRIGVNLGDVMVEGDQVYGDGVNVAARLESLAEPGGICISSSVHEQVRRKLSHAYEDIGEQTLKNIADPVRVYRVGEATEAGRDDGSKLTVPGFAGRPAIAVLAFDNLSGDPEQEYFADGIAEDLITRLSDSRQFPVIARNSSFTYKGKAVDVRRVSRELGVRYIVEGSVRRASDRLRISAQLIDATTGEHVWADRFDRAIDDLFAVQDEVSEAIVGAIGGEIWAFEQERAVRRRPENIDAWDLLMRGYWHLNRFEKEDNAKARLHFEEAVTVDPHFAQAFAGLAEAHYLAIIYGWTEMSAETIAEADRLARSSVEFDDKEPSALLAAGFVCMLKGQRHEMMAAMDRSIELNPNNVRQHATYGVMAALAGRPDDAIAQAEKGMRLSPRDPLTWWLQHAMGVAHFTAGRYEDAVTWARKALRGKRDFPYAHCILAASCGFLGRTQEAQAAVDEVRRLRPGVSLSDFRQIFAAADTDFMDRYVEGLRKAGWKED